jgi:hypothetical protein
MNAADKGMQDAGCGGEVAGDWCHFAGLISVYQTFAGIPCIVPKSYSEVSPFKPTCIYLIFSHPQPLFLIPTAVFKAHPSSQSQYKYYAYGIAAARRHQSGNVSARLARYILGSKGKFTWVHIQFER